MTWFITQISHEFSSKIGWLLPPGREEIHMLNIWLSFHNKNSNRMFPGEVPKSLNLWMCKSVLQWTVQMNRIGCAWMGGLVLLLSSSFAAGSWYWDSLQELKKKNPWGSGVNLQHIWFHFSSLNLTSDSLPHTFLIFFGMPAFPVTWDFVIFFSFVCFCFPLLEVESHFSKTVLNSLCSKEWPWLSNPLLSLYVVFMQC